MFTFANQINNIFTEESDTGFLYVRICGVIGGVLRHSMPITNKPEKKCIMRIKERIYKLVETGEHGQKINRLFDYVIMTLIILSVISIILESINEIDEKYYRLLIGFNVFSVIVFTIEYLLRLYVSDISFPSETRIKSALKYIFSTYGIIDLLAILPFYLPMLIKVDLRFLRVLRLTRFLRILK